MRHCVSDSQQSTNYSPITATPDTRPPRPPPWPGRRTVPPAAPARSAQGRPVIIALDHVGNRPGQVFRVAGVGQHAVLTMPDGLGHARHPRGHHRHSGRHRFEHDHRQPLAKQAGQYEEVHFRQLVDNVAGEARPGNVLGQPELLDAGGQLGPRTWAIQTRPPPATARQSLAAEAGPSRPKEPRSLSAAASAPPRRASSIRWASHDRAGWPPPARRWARLESAPDRTLLAPCVRPRLARRQSPATPAAGLTARRGR